MWRDNKKIKICVNTTLKGKAPENFNWARYNASFKIEEITPYKLASIVFAGYSFAPVFTGSRKKENFMEANHIAFDFDDLGADLDSLMAIPLVDYFASFAYSTPSSTPERPKSRVVFILSEPITDATEYEALYITLARVFNENGSITDPQCKDALRLFYGSIGCEIRGNWSIFPIAHRGEDNRGALSYIEDAYPAPPAPPQPIRVTRPATTISASWVADKLDWAAREIANAPQGTRHGTRLKIATTIGGYVATGAITRADAESVLIAAANANKDKGENAERDIIDGLDYGLGKPLHKEEAKTFKDVRR